MKMNALKIIQFPDYVQGVNYTQTDDLSLGKKLKDIQVWGYGTKKTVYFIGQGLEMQALFPESAVFKRFY